VSEGYLNLYVVTNLSVLIIAAYFPTAKFGMMSAELLAGT
jgi:hypothetical protein